MFAAWLPAVISMLVFHSRFIKLVGERWPNQDNRYNAAGALVTVGSAGVFGFVMWLLLPFFLDLFCSLVI